MNIYLPGYGAFLVLLTAACTTDARMEPKIFKKIESGLRVGSINVRNMTARSEMHCSMGCYLLDQCNAYQYLSVEGINCLLIFENGTQNDNQTIATGELAQVYKEFNPCNPHPCQNDGKCDQYRNSPETFQCACPSGFGGNICQNCTVDWCPPVGFTADALPVVYRAFNDTDNIELHNGAELGDGKLGQAIHLDRATSDWVDLGKLSLACITRPETCGPVGAAVVIWMKLTNCKVPGCVISSIGQEYGTGFHICCSFGGTLRYDLHTSQMYYSLTLNFEDSKWVQVVLNYLGQDVDLGGINVYNDKEFIGSKTNGIAQESSSGTSDVVLGRRFTDDDGSYTSAQVDELMFFNRNLSESDIEAYYNFHQ